MKKIFLILSLASFDVIAIVNVEAMMKKGSDKPFNASAQLSYTEIDSRSTFQSFGAGINLRYLSKLQKLENRILFRDRLFGTFATQKSKKNSEDVQDNQFYHLRYTRMLTEWFGLEALAQQEEDLFTSLEKRQLYGLSSRYDFHLETFKLIAGLGLLKEKEVVKITNRIETITNRISTHMNLVIPVKKELADLSFIIFYQPAINELSDYRMFFTTLLEFHLYKNLKFSFSHQMVQDSLPPVGVPRVTATTKQMITYSY